MNNKLFYRSGVILTPRKVSYWYFLRLYLKTPIYFFTYYVPIGKWLVCLSFIVADVVSWLEAIVIVYNVIAVVTVYNDIAVVTVYNIIAIVVVYNIIAVVTVYNDIAVVTVYNDIAVVTVYNDIAVVTVYNIIAIVVVYNIIAVVIVYNIIVVIIVWLFRLIHSLTKSFTHNIITGAKLIHSL